MTKLKSLASEPKENNTFLIEDYNGLKGILDNFQKKIFNFEGTTPDSDKLLVLLTYFSAKSLSTESCYSFKKKLKWKYWSLPEIYWYLFLVITPYSRNSTVEVLMYR